MEELKAGLYVVIFLILLFWKKLKITPKIDEETWEEKETRKLKNKYKNKNK